MPLSFYTNPQQMTFVDKATLQVQNAWALQPGKVYDVFFVIQNDESVEKTNVHVTVTHSPFGIGLTAGDSYIIQPAPVNVPPKGPGGNGLATVYFQLTAPAAGHGCLVAKIEPSGPYLNQNLTVNSATAGSSSTFSFLVFGDPNADTDMVLTLTERLSTGAHIPLNGTGSWKPVLIPPPGVGFSSAGNGIYTIHLPAGSVYSIGLQVSIPPADTSTHIFNIRGTVNGQYKGEVDIRITGSPTPVPKPDPYIHGTYQSADILIIDPATNTEVPLGGMPGGAWDTTLEPNKAYKFSARVYNSSATPAVNTVVRFWEFPGGVGSAGTLIDVKTATIPANGNVVVESSKPFVAAAPHNHKCAAVSIYNAAAGTCPDASTAAQVPDPCAAPDHSCSAWRNTDSMAVAVGKQWEINLQAAYTLPGPGPVEIDVKTQYVPADWKLHPTVNKMASMLKLGGGAGKVSMHLLDGLQDTMKAADLKANIKVNADVKVTPIKQLSIAAPKGSWMEIPPAGVFRLDAHDGRKVPFTVSGVVPDYAKPGDVFVVKVTAHYGKTAAAPARAVEFTQTLYVK